MERVFGARGFVSSAVLTAALLAGAVSAMGQAAANIPRISNGKPNLNGVWQVANTANWDLQTHGPSQGPPQFGALLSAPPGVGVVDGEEIPYLPKAIEQRNKKIGRAHV